jgi:hypothetical protein
MKHYPRLRRTAWHGGLSLREGLNICFYMRQPHAQLAPALARALDIYLRAVGPAAPSWFPDDTGDWWELDGSAWDDIRRKLGEGLWPGGLLLDWCESPNSARGYAIEYRGKERLHLDEDPGAVCALSFWLPTEHMETQGPDPFRELALQLAQSLPFCSGHAGLAFNRVGAQPDLELLRSRHPGIDEFELMNVSWHIGTRVRGPSWMNFLGAPVLGELGGTSGLRARLLSPDISVQELPGERAVITLGTWPEAGDTEQGHTLPLHRELARVLEPWLYHQPPLNDPEQARATRRWERRFLD